MYSILLKKKIFFSSIVTILFALSLSLSHAQEEQFLEGGHYELLDEVQPVQTGDKIEVVRCSGIAAHIAFDWSPISLSGRKTCRKMHNMSRFPLY